MKRFVNSLKPLQDFFLHIQINTLNLPHTRLPRPHRASRVSLPLRKLFEQGWIRKIFGANIAAAMIMVPLFGPKQSAVVYEPPINVVTGDLVSTNQNSYPITTTQREYVVPVNRLRYVGQGFSAGHLALDLNSYIGEPVRAFSAGRVQTIESGQFGLGRYIILDHGQELFSVYAHLKSFTVSPGQTVDAGQTIGEVGMTGYTTGPHLHFEIHDSGRPINPSTYLDI